MPVYRESSLLFLNTGTSMIFPENVFFVLLLICYGKYSVAVALVHSVLSQRRQVA